MRRHARELHVHCYRMTGSFEESEDLVQETFLRAWRKREQFAGRSTLRAWLYRSRRTPASTRSTSARGSRPPTARSCGCSPTPTRCSRAAADEDGPEDAVVAKETIELTFLTAIQHLRAAAAGGAHPARRPGLLGQGDRRPARDDGAPSVNSALQRARAGLREHLPEPRARVAPGAGAAAPSGSCWPATSRPASGPTLRASSPSCTTTSASRCRRSPGCGRAATPSSASWVDGGFGSDAFGSLRCVVTRANRQPAVACYVRQPGGRRAPPLAIDVLRIEDGRVRRSSRSTAACSRASTCPRASRPSARRRSTRRRACTARRRAAAGPPSARVFHRAPRQSSLVNATPTPSTRVAACSVSLQLAHRGLVGCPGG